MPVNRKSPVFFYLFILVVVFAFYVATSAWMVFPGQSAEFLAALCFPGQMPLMWGNPLDALAIGVAVWLVPPSLMLPVVSLLAAFWSALAVTAFACVAHIAIRVTSLHIFMDTWTDRERTYEDLVLVRRIAAGSVALIGMVALPLWAQGTRPLPSGVMTAFCASALALTLWFLYRATHAPSKIGKWAVLRQQLALGGIFALLPFLGLTSPFLSLVAVLCIIIGGKVLFMIDPEHLHRCFIWIGVGLLLGAGLAYLAWVVQSVIFFPDNAVDFSSWLEYIQISWRIAIGSLSWLGVLVPLAFFIVEGVLFVGCFPKMFQSPGHLWLGQVFVVLSMGMAFVAFPECFWENFGEPTPLAAMAMGLGVVNIGLLIASWCYVWLEYQRRHPARRARTLLVAGALLVSGAIAVWVGLRTCDEGAGVNARRICGEALEVLDAKLPKDCTLWRNPRRSASRCLVAGYASGRALCPVTNWAHLPKDARLGNRLLTACAEEDPVLKEALEIGGFLPIIYLAHSEWRNAVRSECLPTSALETIVNMADHIRETRFGETAVGRRYLMECYRLAARIAIARAFTAPPEESATWLRKARQWDAGNPSSCLSLGALASEGVALTPEEEQACAVLYERDPGLLAPSFEKAKAFEAAFGPVRNAAFRAAKRMQRFVLKDRDAVLQQICEAYRKTPDVLTGQERKIALLALPEREVAELLMQNDPSPEELELYLCLYPRTDASRALYAKYKVSKLAGDRMLAIVYSQKSGMRTLQTHISESFFARDGRFSSALLHVNDLLKEEQEGLEEAVTFVSGFTVGEKLASELFAAEYLRLKTGRELLKANHPQALALLRTWVQSEPHQPSLWALLLSADVQYATPEQRNADLEQCLRLYPLLPIAVDLFAQKLREDVGEEAATRWETTIKKHVASPRQDYSEVLDAYRGI